MTRHALQLALLLSLALLTHAWPNPIAWLRKHAAPADPVSSSDDPTSGTAASSFLWSWAWGGDSTLSIVDHTPVLEFASRPAAFGAYISDPLLGYVMPLSSFTRNCEDGEDTIDEGEDEGNLGCPRLCVGDGQPDSSESWIALVQRGTCQFVDKAREAQRLGAKAVVVGGDDPVLHGNPDVLINMFSPGDSSDLKIPATFIKYTDYIHLSSLIAASNTSHSGISTLSLLISPGTSNWDWYSPIVTFAILLLLPSTLTLTTLLVHRVRTARQAQLDRAPEDVVNSLPWRVWTGTGWEKHSGPVERYDRPTTPEVEEGFALSPSARMDHGTSSSKGREISADALNRITAALAGAEAAAAPVAGPSTSATITPPVSTEQHPAWFDNQSECAICLSEFAKGDKVRVLPCNHIFHLDEVDEWLTQRKKLCPVCKADVTCPAPVPGSSSDPIDASGAPSDSPAHAQSAPSNTHPGAGGFFAGFQLHHADESITPYLARRSYGEASSSPPPHRPSSRSSFPPTERTPLLEPGERDAVVS